jgi:hypothetical protein
MMEFEDTELEELPLDGDLTVPRIRMTTYGLPDIEIMLGDQHYQYERSYPIKGHMATLPKAVREGLGAGKKPLIIERSDRFYLYFEK